MTGHADGLIDTLLTYLIDVTYGVQVTSLMNNFVHKTIYGCNWSECLLYGKI
jgi:hypothetical protein